MTSINQKALCDCLDAFSESTGVPVTLYNPDGGILEEFLQNKKFCKFFATYRQPGECVNNLVFSTRFSYEMGGPYIYSCPIGLVHIAVPIILNGQYSSCAVAGPLSMGPMNEERLGQAIAINPSCSASLAKIALFISGMEVYTPNQIHKLSLLLYSAVLQSNKNWKDYEQANMRYQQQAMVGEHIRKRKKRAEEQIKASPLAPTYSELELRLREELKACNREGAISSMEMLFEELVLIEGGNFDSVKLHIFELYISLARAASESGATLRNIFGGNFEQINSLNGLNTIEELAFWAKDTITYFTDQVFSALPQISPTASRAISYINAHYMDKLTLRNLAGDLFLNESYLSKLFRQELDTGFTEYLNRVRIDHSMELMRGTDKSLSEIAGMVGFEDQSYFTKIFKKFTGLTPRQYKGGLADEKNGGQLYDIPR